MNEIKYIDVDVVDPNPYQAREHEDPEHVRKIAESILDSGLMQFPAGRAIEDGRVQLAFGHTRLAAFRLIASTGLGRLDADERDEYQRIPVIIREMTDIEMFEIGAGENLARKDLSPIEEARLMRRYRDEFKKTSPEIGKLFGMSESAVRNKMRLLDLPDEAQASVASGQISEGTARSLLSLQRAVKPEKMPELIQDVVRAAATDPGRVQEAIEGKLKINTVELHKSWRNGAETAGEGLWLLDYILDADLPFPTWTQFQKAYNGPESFTWDGTVPGEAHVGPAFPRTWSLKDTFGKVEIQWPAAYMRKHLVAMGAREVLETCDFLVRPPACTACPNHVKQNGSHYCGLRVCWERRREGWARRELARLVERTGIQAYDPERDGKGIVAMPRYKWGDDRELSEWFEKQFKAKSTDLRLKIKIAADDHQLTGSPLVQVIAIGDKAGEKKEADAKANQAEKEAERQLELSRQRREEARVFVHDVATPEFMKALIHLPGGVLESLASKFTRWDLDQMGVPGDMKPIQRNAWIVTYDLLWSPVRNNLQSFENGPVALAKHLQGVAIGWGVHLPENWLELAKEMEA